MQSASCILFKQSHLISYGWMQPGKMNVFDSGWIIGDNQNKFLKQKMRVHRISQHDQSGAMKERDP